MASLNQAQGLGEKVQSRSEVAVQLDNLSSVRDALEGRMQGLERRLQFVMRPTAPAAAGGTVPRAASPLAPLAQSLEQLHTSFDDMADRLSDMIDRLELPE